MPTDTTTIPDVYETLEERAGISSFRHRANGLEVLVLPMHEAPVATLMVTYRVGSRNEPTGLTGATHFLEHLMFKGTERFNKDLGTSVFQVLQAVGAQVNATTWVDRTNYYALLPSEQLELAARIESDRMRGARLRDVDVDSERTVILNELDRGENEPFRRLYQAVWSMAFNVHPYRHPTIGWRADVETVTAQGLRHFYDTYYWPENAVVTLVGDTSIPDALALVDRHFGSIPNADRPIPALAVVEPPQSGPRRLVIRMKGDPGIVMMAWKGPAGLDRRADELALIGMILSRGKNGRLYRALIDSGLAMSQSASVSRFRDPGLFQVFGMPAPGHAHAEIEEAVRRVLAELGSEGVTVSELERAKRQLKADESFGRDGPFSIAGRLNEAIAAGDWRLYADASERVADITVDALKTAAMETFVDRTETVGWFEPVVTP